MSFIVGDINRVALADFSFDVILSIDSNYFSADYLATLRSLKTILRPGGQLAIFYSYGREPLVPIKDFQVEKLPPKMTPLAAALQENGLPFTTWDLTQQDYELAQLRKKVLADLKPQFEVEDIMFIYENRMGEAEGMSQAIETGLHTRYLYHVQLS